MAVRKLKPVEANDGSYGGRVLAAFDQLTDPSHVTEPLRTLAPITLPEGFVIVTRPDGSQYGRPTLALMFDLDGPAWDGTRMRVIEMGRGL